MRGTVVKRLRRQAFDEVMRKKLYDSVSRRYRDLKKAYKSRDS